LRSDEAISVLAALFVNDLGEERPHVRGA